MAAAPDSVRLARSEIVRWFHELGRSDDQLAASIALAVSEAVANVVRHAYPGDASGRVEIDAVLEDRQILVSVSDGGSGLVARADREHNGMGLPVIGRVADGVTVNSYEGGTKVAMRFELTRPADRRTTRGRSYAISVG